MTPRALQVHQEIVRLRGTVSTDMIRMAELLAEVRQDGLWEGLMADDGRAYDSFVDYGQKVLGMSERTVFRMLAVGTALSDAPVGTQKALRATFGEVGIGKAQHLARVLQGHSERPWAEWVEQARALPVEEFRRIVSQEFHVARRLTPEKAASQMQAIVALFPEAWRGEVEAILTAGMARQGEPEPVAVLYWALVAAKAELTEEAG